MVNKEAGINTERIQDTPQGIDGETYTGSAAVWVKVVVGFVIVALALAFLIASGLFGAVV